MLNTTETILEVDHSRPFQQLITTYNINSWSERIISPFNVNRTSWHINVIASLNCGSDQIIGSADHHRSSQQPHSPPSSLQSPYHTQCGLICIYVYVYVYAKLFKFVATLCCSPGRRASFRVRVLHLSTHGMGTSMSKQSNCSNKYCPSKSCPGQANHVQAIQP